MKLRIGYRIRLTKDLHDGKTGRNPIKAGATGRVSCVSRGMTFSTISVRWDEPYNARNLYVDENVDEFEIIGKG